MDIAAASIGLSQAKLMQAVSVALAKKVMSQQENQAAALISQMQAAVPPAVNRLDIKA